MNSPAAVSLLSAVIVCFFYILDADGLPNFGVSGPGARTWRKWLLVLAVLAFVGAGGAWWRSSDAAEDALGELGALLAPYPGSRLVEHQSEADGLGYCRWVFEAEADIDQVMRQQRDAVLERGWSLQVSNRSTPRWLCAAGDGRTLCAFVARQGGEGVRIEYALFDGAAGTASAVHADRPVSPSAAPARDNRGP